MTLYDSLQHRINQFDAYFVDSFPTLPQCFNSTLFHHSRKFAAQGEASKATRPQAQPVDGLPGKLLDYGGECLARRLHCFIGKVWLAETMPQPWDDANIVTVHKSKGNKTVYGNCRSIYLVAAAWKIRACILLARLPDAVTEIILPELQSSL